jgi:RNA polymerase sigma-70 factor (ECF subfamily)
MSVSKDIVQDIFVKIWEGKININKTKSVKSFLYTIVKNECVDYIKFKIKEKDSLKYIAELTNDLSFDKAMIEEEIHFQIHLAIKKLSIKSQEIIILTLGGMTNPEIAEELEISINTVKTIKKRAYKNLREEIRTKNIDTNKANYILMLLFGE